MLKRITTMILLMAILTACSGAPAQIDASQSPNTSASVSTESTPAPVPTAEPTEEPVTEPLLSVAPTVTATPIAAPTAAPTPAPTPAAGGAAEVVKPSNQRSRHIVYSWNPADYTYHRIGGNNRNSRALGDELLGYKAVPDAKPEENPVELLGFLVLKIGDSKESYYLTPTQLYSKERGVLDATPQQCRVLHVMAKANNKSEKGNAQWLRYMSPQKLTEVKFTGNALDEAMTDIGFTTSDTERMQSMATSLSNIDVQPDSTIKFESGVEPNPSTSVEAMTVKLTFDTGVVYDVWIFDDMLYIFSSDMEYSMGYRMKSASLRLNAESIYYCLHPELELPKHMEPNPDT